MLFNLAKPTLSLGKLRKSSDVLTGAGQPAISLESVYLARRRSLSLDDLGLVSPPSLPTSMMDDTDEDLDDLPSQGEVADDAVNVGTEPTESSSLSTIREASPIHSVEEWSPSPADDEDNPSELGSSTTLELRNNLANIEVAKSKSLPRGIQNYLAKWKNMIKK